MITIHKSNEGGITVTEWLTSYHILNEGHADIIVAQDFEIVLLDVVL